MSSEPTITFSIPSTLTTIEYLDLTVSPYDDAGSSYATHPFSYVLYSEDDQFDPWVEWVTNNREDATTNQEQNAIDYSGYTLSIQCDLSLCTTSEVSCGCCLQDKSGQEGGAYCWVLNSAMDDGDTYFLTHD